MPIRTCDVFHCNRDFHVRLGGKQFCTEEHFAQYFGFEFAQGQIIFPTSLSVIAGRCDVCGQMIRNSMNGFLDSDGRIYWDSQHSTEPFFVEETSRVLCRSCADTIAATMTKHDIRSRRMRIRIALRAADTATTPTTPTATTPSQPSRTYTD